MNMVDEILLVDSVSSHYDGEPLLRRIRFGLAEGEILALLGPSGSGKSTLLRVLAGLEPCEEGRIVFKGRDLAGVEPHRRQIGMMFQEYALFPHQTVWQNVAFGLEMQKLAPADIEQKVETMLELVGLADFGSRRIDQLSGGERQRVALARSLAPQPQLLLLDEPLGSLDRMLRDRLAQEIRTILKKLGVTAIFVTHDQAEAFSVADKVAILDGGSLRQFDTPERIYRHPQSRGVASFLGFDNFIDAEVDQSGAVHCSQPELSALLAQVKVDRSAGKALVLLRPDGAEIATGHQATGVAALAGTVHQCRFLGSAYRLTLGVGDILLNFDLPLDPKPPGVGSPVELTINPASVVVMGDQ